MNNRRRNNLDQPRIATLAAVSLLVVVLMSLATPQRSVAGTGMVVVMPPRKVAPKSRLQMSIDTSWISAQGYVPVKVTFRPIGSRVFPADRNLVVDFRPAHWGSLLGTRLEVSREIELPESEAEASVTLYVPQVDTYQGFAVRVYEDGKDLADLSDKSPIQNPTGFWSATAFMSVAHVTYDVPSIYKRRTPTTAMRPMNTDVRLESTESIACLTRLVGAQGNYNAVNLPMETWLAYKWPQVSAAVGNVEFMHPTDLPTLPLGLSSLDLVLIDRQDLKRMSEEHPQHFEALRRWLLAGGILFSTGAGDDFSDRTEVEELFNLAPQTLCERSNLMRSEMGMLHGELSKPKSFAGDRWRHPCPNDFGTLIAELKNTVRSYSDDPDSKPDAEETQALKQQSPFILRRAQFGQLVLTNSEAFKLKTYDWNLLMKAIPDRQWDWNNRNGVELAAANDGFWDFMIPGVGLPPVTAFQVLITIFALVIGPLNYAVLSKRRKLSWLMLSVPLGSLVTILGLVTFAMLTDGISIRSRARSLTHVDHRSQHAVSFSRQSYYAGLAPAEGLVFPEDAVVVPIDHIPVAGGGIARHRRVIEHQGNKIRYRVGYLPSRTTVQYYVTQSRSTEKTVSLDEDSDGALRMLHHLGAAATILLYRDEEGKFYSGSDIKPNTQTELKEVSLEDAKELLTSIVADDKLEPPMGLDRSLLREGFIGNSQNYYGNNNTRTRNRTNSMERTMAKIANGKAERMSANSYIAVVESNDEIPMGVEKHEDQQSLHIVMGQF